MPSSYNFYSSLTSNFWSLNFSMVTYTLYVRSIRINIVDWIIQKIYAKTFYWNNNDNNDKIS